MFYKHTMSVHTKPIVDHYWPTTTLPVASEWGSVSTRGISACEARTPLDRSTSTWRCGQRSSTWPQKMLKQEQCGDKIAKIKDIAKDTLFLGNSYFLQNWYSQLIKAQIINYRYDQICFRVITVKDVKHAYTVRRPRILRPGTSSLSWCSDDKHGGTSLARSSYAGWKTPGWEKYNRRVNIYSSTNTYFRLP